MSTPSEARANCSEDDVRLDVLDVLVMASSHDSRGGYVTRRFRNPFPGPVGNKLAFVCILSVSTGYRQFMESPLGSFLCPPGFAGPTGLRAIAREGSAVTEVVRFVRRSAHDRRQQRGTPYALRAPDEGQAPVVLVPGFMAGDGTLGLMSRHLRRFGHRTYRSLMHANVG